MLTSPSLHRPGQVGNDQAPAPSPVRKSPLTNRDRRALRNVRPQRLLALEEHMETIATPTQQQMDTIVTTTQQQMHEQRLAAIEHSGKASWETRLSPERVEEIRRLLVRDAGLTMRLRRCQRRRGYGGLEGHIRQSRETVWVADARDRGRLALFFLLLPALVRV